MCEMAKFKLVKKGYKAEVKVSLVRGEQINGNELQILSSCSGKGLVVPSLAGKKKLIYDVSGKATLAQYLLKQMSTDKFLGLLMQTVDVTKCMQEKGLNYGNLTLDHNFVFINEATKQMVFLYQPIVGKKSISDTLAFLAYIISAVRLDGRKDWNIINSISGFINTRRFYSPEEFEQCLISLVPSLGRKRQSHAPNDFSKKTGCDPDTMILEETETSILKGTSLLDENFGGSPFDERTTRVYLIREKTKEHILIDKPVFRVGKEKSYVDCFINDNNAVSRIHADFIKDGERCYIKDTNSTNGTFVNGNMINTNVKTEIYDGDAVMLANERFTFHIERDR